jgi:hypothetical protein
MAKLSEDEKEMLIGEIKTTYNGVENDEFIRELIFDNVIVPYLSKNRSIWKEDLKRIAKGKSLRTAKKWVKEALIENLIETYNLSPQQVIYYIKKALGKDYKRKLEKVNNLLAEDLKELAIEEWNEIKRSKNKKLDF